MCTNFMTTRREKQFPHLSSEFVKNIDICYWGEMSSEPESYVKELIAHFRHPDHQFIFCTN